MGTWSLILTDSEATATALCRCFAVWLVIVHAGQYSFAQGLGDWTNVQNLTLNSAISVTTKRREKHHGKLVSVTPESLTIDSDERGFPGRVTTRRALQRGDIQEVRFLAPMASVLAGAGIGAGVGGGLGRGLESTAKSNADRGLLTGVLITLGLVTGAAIAHHYPLVKGKLVYVVR